MPVENERKYVLDAHVDYKTLLGKETEWFDVLQGYLFLEKNQVARVRKDQAMFGEPKFWFTYKQTQKTDLIEIETLLSQQDFEKLFATSQHQVKKIRARQRYFGQLWEFDFFDFDGLKLVIAEIELLPNQMYPDHVPDWISKHCIYQVKPGDWRWQNSNFTSQSIVKDLLASINN